MVQHLPLDGKSYVILILAKDGSAMAVVYIKVQA
jgi:hypothetical protein